MITKIKDLFGKKKGSQKIDPLQVDEVLSVFRQPKGAKKEEQTFIGDFEAVKIAKPLNQPKEQWIPSVAEQKPMRMNKRNRDLLKRSIVISLDFPVNRPDLEFVANSRIDGKPIYRYIGDMPFRLDVPFEELMSLEDF